MGCAEPCLEQGLEQVLGRGAFPQLKNSLLWRRDERQFLSSPIGVLLETVSKSPAELQVRNTHCSPLVNPYCRVIIEARSTLGESMPMTPQDLTFLNMLGSDHPNDLFQHPSRDGDQTEMAHHFLAPLSFLAFP